MDLPLPPRSNGNSYLKLACGAPTPSTVSSGDNWTYATVSVDGKPTPIEWTATPTKEKDLSQVKIRESDGREYSVSLNNGQGNVLITSGRDGRYTMSNGDIDTARVRCINADYGTKPTASDFTRGVNLFKALQKTPEYQEELTAAGINGNFNARPDASRAPAPKAGSDGIHNHFQP